MVVCWLWFSAFDALLAAQILFAPFLLRQRHFLGYAVISQDHGEYDLVMERGLYDNLAPSGRPGSGFPHKDFLW